MTYFRGRKLKLLTKYKKMKKKAEKFSPYDVKQKLRNSRFNFLLVKIIINICNMRLLFLKQISASILNFYTEMTLINLNLTHFYLLLYNTLLELFIVAAKTVLNYLLKAI